MIGITVTGEAYAAIASRLPARSSVEGELVPEYCLWFPRDVVTRLRGERAPGETFSETIIRLAESGEFAALTR